MSTCDDDILRQAMGDDNTVSFVFGLEVNWDLLQVSVEAKKEETAAYVAQVRGENDWMGSILSHLYL